MKKTALLIMMLLVLIVLYSVKADEYLIGAYSQYQLRYVDEDDVDDKFTTLGEKLKEAGFNAASFSVVEEDDVSNKLATAIGRFNNYGIRS